MSALSFYCFRSHKSWRTWLVAYLFVALAWPATGPLPWLVFETAEHVAANTGGHHGDGTVDAADGAAQRDSGGAGVPGSPTHPLDHNCAQCEVLKHLARCVLPDACEPGVAPAPGQPVAPLGAQDSPHASVLATRARIRGPPRLSV